ncbi:MAG: PQQ-binding-like beta-propeller repeat protein, partial [Caulobacteraceae bacterium]
EFAAKTVEYGCCKSVGAVVALDAGTGRQLWKTFVIPERPKVMRVNSKGVEQFGPAGAPIWNTPTIDPVRRAVYFGTGDATTYPAAETSDAVMALSMDTGKILWSHQVHGKDSFLVGCRAGDVLTENCPKVQGPDWDIPAPAILTTAPGGKRLLLVGTKPGDVLAVDPDNNGAQVWRVNVHGGKLAGDGPTAPTPVISGILWGGAVENGVVYYGLTGGGMAALKVATGERVWMSPLNSRPEAPISHGSPSTAVPGAVLVGGNDGKLQAVSTDGGRILWTAETAKPFDTVNKVAAKGGSIISGGPTVAGGMVFIGSGYGVNRGAPGNVVLAYGVR